MKKKWLFIYFAVLFSIKIEGDDANPFVARVYADQYTGAIQPYQNDGAIGTLDASFNATVDAVGSISVAAQLPGGQAQVMQVLSDGTFLVAMSKSDSNTNIGKYNAQGTLLSSSFGVLGIADLGASTAEVQAMMVDTQGRIVVVGGDAIGCAGWIKRVTADGMQVTSFATNSDWQYIAAIAEQKSGKIIVVGFNGRRAQIARYNGDGSLDSTFGALGFIVLDGLTSITLRLPVVTTGLYSVVVDEQDLIYVAYVDSVGGAAHVARFTAFGFLDTNFAVSGIVDISYLNSATLPLYMAIDMHNNLVVASQIGIDILVTAINSLSGGDAIPAFDNATISSSGNSLSIRNLMTASDGAVGTIFIMGSNTTLQKSRITRLTNSGDLDLAFHGTGFHEFSVGSPSTSSSLFGSGLSPDGQVYGVGYQIANGVTTSYVSRFYNNLNTYQISQSPLTQEQGTFDARFGATPTQANPGVVTPFNGSYRKTLQQTAHDVIELQSGKLLVGMDGYLNTSAQSNMMLIRLLPSGILDESFGIGGKLTLPNLTASNEHLTSIIEDESGNIYVTGYASATQGEMSTRAIFRKYTAAGTSLWVADIQSALSQGLTVALQGSIRALLFAQVDATHGQISAHNLVDGTIDTSFHAQSSHPGFIYAADYAHSAFHLGPVFNGIVDTIGNIFIAYKDSLTGAVNAAAIFSAAPWLMHDFGTKGVVHDIFSSSAIEAHNIRASFDYKSHIIVAAASASSMQVALLDALTGDLSKAFHHGTILTISIPGATSVMLNKVVGLSDGSFVLTGYDAADDDTMLIVRVDKYGHLDTTFNALGSTQGILPLKIGEQITAYNARVATSLAIQSTPGSDQGNMVVSAYEKQFSSDATPIVLHLFGQPGTTGVKTWPAIVIIPGNLDSSYNGNGFATTYADGTLSPAAHQQVKAIRQLTGGNIMTVVSNGINSWTTKLQSDGSLDTSYGVGSTASFIIPKDVLSGADVAEQVNGMVFDGIGRMLIFGSNQLLGGYVKRINLDGSPDATFGGFMGHENSVFYPAGTVYGLLTHVAGVAELSSGEIVVVGDDHRVGTAILISSTGVPLTTFGTGGSAINCRPGTVTYGVSMTSVSVDACDKIYISVGYVDVNNNWQAGILKLDATGIPVKGFGTRGATSTNGFVACAIAHVDNFKSISLVLDSCGKVMIAASCMHGLSGQIAVARFGLDGLADRAFIGDAGPGTQRNILFPVASDVTTIMITNMLSLQNRKTLISGFQCNASFADNQNYEFIACIDAHGCMDGSFDSGPLPGLVMFQVDARAQYSRHLFDINTQANGKILLAGAESSYLHQETPFTGRLNGYTDVQSIPQFSGEQSEAQDFLNRFFNETGVASTGQIPDLVDGGQVVVDFLGRPIVAGYTSDHKIVFARFTKLGVLDTTFGIDGTGIIITDPIINFLSGGYLAIDADNNILSGGITVDHRFILIRCASDGIIDSSFGQSGGIVRSAPLANLTMGGYLMLDSLHRPVLGGMTSDGNLVAARFTDFGLPDISFGLSGIAVAPVPSLVSGGYIATNRLNQVIVTGMTTVQRLVAVKFDIDGNQDITFGTAGIASTNTIPDLSMGGSVGIDSQSNIVIGGCTTNQEFVVVKLRQDGELDTTFGQTGVVFSNPIDVLTAMGSLVIDSSDRIVIAGQAREFDGLMSMVVARFSPLGIIDSVFSTNGLATTGPIIGLSMGGYVCTNVFDNIFIGGIISDAESSSLLITEIYSGEEIFIADVLKLSPAEYKIFRYGNNPDSFRKFLGVDLFAVVITDQIAHDAIVASVASLLDEYVLIYASAPGWNLIWHLYRYFTKFLEEQLSLVARYPASASQIELFFARFHNRMLSLKKK